MNGFILTIVLTLMNNQNIPMFIKEPFATEELCTKAGDKMVDILSQRDEVKSMKFVCTTTEQFKQFNDSLSKSKSEEETN